MVSTKIGTTTERVIQEFLSTKENMQEREELPNW
jgi:hypothetical protein